MGKMMARYAETSGKNRATLRFLFDGDKVVDGDTPASVSVVKLLAVWIETDLMYSWRWRTVTLLKWSRNRLVDDGRD